MPSSSDSLREVGHISGAHGIRGEVKIKSRLIPPEGILDLPLCDKTGTRGYRILSHKIAGGGIVVRLEGVGDRNQAELLKGIKLYAPRKETGDGQMLPEEISGLPARLKNGAVYGKIAGMYDFGAGPLIEIRKLDGGEEMLPLKKPFAELRDDFVLVEPPEYLEEK